MATCIAFLIVYVFCTRLANPQICEKDDENCIGDNSGSTLFKDHIREKLQELPVNNYPSLTDKRYVIEDGQNPIVLWWYNSVYPHPNGQHTELQCKLGSCTVSEDRKDLQSTLTRGFVFYGSSFLANDLPLPRLPHHEWGLFHEESPKNNWMISHELGISIFNHTATFRRESDYPLTTQFIPDTDKWIDDEFFITTSEKNRFQREEGLGLAAYVQRDCNPPSDRDMYVTELMKYVKIDSFGPCVNNRKMPDDVDGFDKLSSRQYYHFLAKYKFQIAFENSLCRDYMTEKLFRPLVIGSVPVYLGSDDAPDFMPTRKAVIMTNDFKSPKQLAHYLIKLNQYDVMYDEYLLHRDTKKLDNPTLLQMINRQPWGIVNKSHKENFIHHMFHSFSCYMCDRIHERNNNLKAHLRDRSHPPQPLKSASLHHMNCPQPKSMPWATESYKHRGAHDIVYNFGLDEAIALVEMLRANETDTKKWRKYLRIKTDKYP